MGPLGPSPGSLRSQCRQTGRPHSLKVVFFFSFLFFLPCSFSRPTDRLTLHSISDLYEPPRIGIRPKPTHPHYLSCFTHLSHHHSSASTRISFFDPRSSSFDHQLYRQPSVLTLVSPARSLP
ncbi:uncharacterized protein LY79DRAFT_49275 [Colletotrichum navitas]|uniref:Uncharacterized protein n=1 Tax=Colletotrichum navitas TaxID=681940 RepID=A0AAD8V9K6_9PEZI|nr:uncharacterized protein LY79DRAFT_49275 [Colletotrichum navitas]KAK1596615.1 hypothetical protein LY79DRAFT_49275 [Colletotrichum navitas]